MSWGFYCVVTANLCAKVCGSPALTEASLNTLILSQGEGASPPQGPGAGSHQGPGSPGPAG